MIWLKIAAIGGAKYFVTFIDDYSRKAFVFTMKSKSEVFAKFVQFKKFVENQLEKTIKIYRSDNGSEYVNNDFQQFCIASGIKIEKSAPYSPQQNGVAERMNRTIIEKVRCMLFDANMSKGFWAEAVHASVDIINILPNSANNNKSPNEIWFGRTPNIDMIRLFGCKAMVMIPQEKRRKLDEKSMECIFLRCADNAKAYRLYNKATKKIVTSRDVVFFENESNMVNENEKSNNFSPILVQAEDTQDNVFGETSTEGDDEELIADSGENAGHNESTISDEETQNISSSSSSSTESEGVGGDPTFQTRANVPKESRPVTRSMNPLHFLNFHVAFHVHEPNTYQEAMKGAYKDEWMAAMKEEYESLVKNNTWKIVERPSDKTVIDNRWVFKIKEKTDGSIDRFKARLVARGFNQQFGVDYNETFSAVVRFTSIRTILAVAANRRMKLKQFDIKTAFLNGKLDDVVYMKQPIGFSDGTDKVCRLIKSLYGLKQAARCWAKRFSDFVKKLGFATCKTDSCVFMKKNNSELVIIALHVDDGLVAADDENQIDELINQLNEQFEVKASGVGCFLGIQIEQDKDGSIFIHQNAYLKKILKRFSMENCKQNNIPCDPNQVLYDNGESRPSDFPYRELVGSLLYLAIGTRPDIAYSVGLIGRFVEKPNVMHEQAAKKILKYLNKTLNFGILYINSKDNHVYGYSDADYAADMDTRRSTSGHCFIYANGTISWSSERQRCVSLSTTESEYVAASGAVKELIWLRNLLSEILDEDAKFKMHMDNQSAIRLVKNPEFHKRSKHIDVRYHFVREKFEEKQFDLEYIQTKEMIADVFTKALPSNQFNFFRTKLGVIEQIKN